MSQRTELLCEGLKYEVNKYNISKTNARNVNTFGK
jgi:hypothetical protein